MLNSFSSKRSLSQKWNKHLLNLHYKKLSKVRTTIKNSSPNDYVHIRSNKKQEQLREGILKTERFTEIERENRILFEKMSYIMNSRSQPRVSSAKKSLNSHIRRKNSAKIANENLALLKRLKNKTPVYNCRQWDKDWKKNEKMIQSISEYPSKKYKVKNIQTQGLIEKGLVFRKGVYIGLMYFMVTIRRENEILKIVLQEPTESECYYLEVNYEDAWGIMRGKDDYEYLASLISIENGEIVLVNPDED
ncbi:hypothetical protein SteCoe_27290 [Stentor coeruleus]|uniref:Uncharacterized protein n=1 Tax=Stentor coeruleus TaxID=5963 RepID=A0A1R2BAV3_9CILI|nr:hypothetical protein SteCoe_27290 [Stentor coeruleus]